MAGKQLGQKGEELAATYLEELGYTILERNWTIRGGELDIVALDPDHETYVFVEVKTLNDVGWSEGPIVNITPHKQAQVIRTSQVWMAKFVDKIPYCRFDVVTVWLRNEFVLDHIAGAFGEGW